MVDKKDLRGNLVKMRDVAELLSAWADDLEKTLTGEEAGPGSGSAAGDSSAPAPSGVSSGGAVAGTSSLGIPVPVEMTLPAVREYLGKVSAAGYKTQVQALVNSFGAEKLSGVNPNCFPALVEAVSALGGDDCAG